MRLKRTLKNRITVWLLFRIGWRPPLIKIDVSGSATAQPQVIVSLYGTGDNEGGGMSIHAGKRGNPLSQQYAECLLFAQSAAKFSRSILKDEAGEWIEHGNKHPLCVA